METTDEIAQIGSDGPEIQNVLLITIDSLRIDSVPESGFTMNNYFQDHRICSFSNAYATGPGTSPSFPALLTGSLPLSYGGLGPLEQHRPALAVNLRKRGYSTAAFHCNPFLSNHFNYDRGFDEFNDYQNPLMGIATRIFPRGIEINNPKLSHIDNIFHITDIMKKSYQAIKGKPRPYVSAEVISDDTISWLNECSKPFFCWTHYMDVHHPCFPPKAYRESHGVGHVTQSQVSELYAQAIKNINNISKDELNDLGKLYHASIDYVDDQISRILDQLKASGHLSNTLVVLTSDHGELAGEHGQFGKPARMYDELLQVPLIIVNCPNSVMEARDELVSLLDIPPLIHHSLGLENSHKYEGQVPGEDSPRNYILAEHEVEGEVIIGARSTQWMYEADEIEGTHRLFDLSEGRANRVPVDDYPDNFTKEVVLERLQKLDVKMHRLEDEVEGDVKSRLKDLGYIN